MFHSREILSVPPVGHGNPATAFALLELALAQGLDINHLVLASTAYAARRFHEGMTQNPDKAEEYKRKSAQRTDLKANVYASASAGELAIRAGMVKRDKIWTVVQEHALLGASQGLLSFLGIDAVRLTTPDVLPKTSGLDAVQKHWDKAQIYVWNTWAQEHLNDRGFNTVLTAPYLHKYRQEGQAGHGLVAKASGSGIPPAWQKGLLGALGKLEDDWAFHTPGKLYTPDNANGEVKSSDMSIPWFYEDVGTDTELLICYPSEMISLAAGRSEAGYPTRILSLPPRGEHELINLRFGVAYGLVAAELALNEEASVEGLRRVKLDSLSAELASIRSEGPTWQRGKGIIGTEPFWQVAGYPLAA